jgi:hypothetical protein
VLVSVIIGLGLVRLLSGVALFVGAARRSYWVHLVWTCNLFFYLVVYWWALWRWSALSEWNLALFLFTLGYAVLLYLLSAVLYPHQESRTDFEEIFFDHRVWFFRILALVAIVDLVDTTLKRQQGLSGFGTFYLAMMSISFICSLIASRTSSRGFHAAWAVGWLLLVTTFAYLNFSTLRST